MAMPSMTPVIRRCLSGEQQAQEELVLAAQNRVYYHCKKMLKHEEDALDATQEILISMLTRLDRLQDPEAFWGWLSAMTANHCRNVLTRGHREAQIPEDDEGNSLLDAFENLDEQSVPDKALDNDETRRMIVDLVDQLPPPQRQCVLMFYYEEMSVRDIAAALETSEGTSLNYARKAIKAGVDAYAAQGIKLYSAVPFLVYFLQKDALSGGLSASAAEALAHTVLAGAAGTAAVETAAAGTAAGGAAASAGSAAAASGGAASHALGGLLAHKAALGLAGLAVVGAVAGGASLYQPEPEPVETTAPIVEAVEPQPIPEPVVEPEPVPEPEPEPTPYPEPVVVPGPEPEPTPVSEPEPEPEPEPVVEPQPVSTPEVRMNFSSYSAGYGDNVAFPISMISGANTPYDGIVYSSTTPAVADVSAIGGIALLSPGTAEIVATFPDDNNYQVRLPVTVEDHYEWSHQWADDPLDLSVGEQGSNYLQQYSLGRDSTLTGTEWSSSNPAVASVSASSGSSNFCNVTALSPGTATITGVYHFDAWTNVGTFPMTDTVSFQVIVS